MTHASSDAPQFHPHHPCRTTKNARYWPVTTLHNNQTDVPSFGPCTATTSSDGKSLVTPMFLPFNCPLKCATAERCLPDCPLTSAASISLFQMDSLGSESTTYRTDHWISAFIGLLFSVSVFFFFLAAAVVLCLLHSELGSLAKEADGVFKWLMRSISEILRIWLLFFKKDHPQAMGNCGQNPLKSYITSDLTKREAKTHIHFFQSPHLKHCYRISEHLCTTVPGTLYPRFCTFHRGLVVSDGMARPALT